ncbi:MAG: FHA domain-containing protein [Bdellovibrionaceae bacterium]|nr:FHA domain-containing protein [Pseudobdellovibrionaceae bacterium]
MSENSAVKFELVATKGPHAGLRVSFEKESIKIGRNPDCDIVLEKDMRVSRIHAEIKQSSGQFTLVNLSQKNFILVDGQQVTSTTLMSGSCIQIGETEFKFTADVPNAIDSPLVPLKAQEETSNPIAPPPVAPRPVAPESPPVVPQPSPSQVWRPPAPPQAPHSHSSKQTSRAALPTGTSTSSPFRLVIIGAVAVVVIFVLTQGGDKKNAPEPRFRTSDKIEAQLAESKAAIEEAREREMARSSVRNKRAQENLIKGLRDYRAGQFARARESFQAVLNMEPDNELAKRYKHLSEIRFDEMVKLTLMQGYKYREKKNYRLCMDAFSKVMVMLQNNQSNPVFREAKQVFDECRALDGVRL